MFDPDLRILINFFTYGILRNGIVCYMPVPQRSGYYYVIRVTAFGVGQMKSGLLCVLRRQGDRMSLDLKICVTCL